jgi:hypothetical protein
MEAGTAREGEGPSGARVRIASSQAAACCGTGGAGATQASWTAGSEATQAGCGCGCGGATATQACCRRRAASACTTIEGWHLATAGWSWCDSRSRSEHAGWPLKDGSGEMEAGTAREGEGPSGARVRIASSQAAACCGAGGAGATQASWTAGSEATQGCCRRRAASTFATEGRGAEGWCFATAGRSWWESRSRSAANATSRTRWPSFVTRGPQSARRCTCGAEHTTQTSWQASSSRCCGPAAAESRAAKAKCSRASAATHRARSRPAATSAGCWTTQGSQCRTCSARSNGGRQ